MQRKGSFHRLQLLAFSFLLLGTLALAWAAYLPGKAWLAQQLLARAWQETLDGSNQVRPWPWADTWPVARLQSGDRDYFVLSDASGRSLAFGPGRLLSQSQSPGPGEQINQSLDVLAGHRDSHFAFLQHLLPGDELHLQSTNGSWQSYEISHSQVLPSPQIDLPQQDSGHLLVLTTCYPFNNLIPRGPRRYAVWAKAM